MSALGKVSIKLVLTGIVAFAAIILLGYAIFLSIGVLQFGHDPIAAGRSFIAVGILLLVVLIVVMRDN